jgi:LPXTG-motif cell wall-anchored protein
VSWSIPAIARDDALELEVTTTVASRQDEPELVNLATLVNPPGYSPPIVADPCSADPDASCARTTVPVTPSGLGQTGTQVPVTGLLAGVLAVAVGAVLVIRRRSARP